MLEPLTLTLAIAPRMDATPLRTDPGDEAYAEQIHYWTTPITQCLDGRTDTKCVAYDDWVKAGADEAKHFDLICDAPEIDCVLEVTGAIAVVLQEVDVRIQMAEYGLGDWYGEAGFMLTTQFFARPS